MEVKKCQWSQNALNSVKGLLKSDPKVRKSVELIKKHICDKKKKLVYCCGPEQQPPSDVLFPDCEHLCSKNPSECDIEGMVGFYSTGCGQSTGTVGITFIDLSHTSQILTVS